MRYKLLAIAGIGLITIGVLSGCATGNSSTPVNNTFVSTKSAPVSTSNTAQQTTGTMTSNIVSDTTTSYTVVPSHFNSIDMTSANNGWGTWYDKTGHFHLAKTTDGGLNWNQVQLPISPPIYDISTCQFGEPGYVQPYFLNSSDGWLVWINDKNRDTTVMRTTDGGAHWVVSHMKLPMSAQIVSNVNFINSMSGWIMETSAVGSESEQKFLFKTTNGGRTWTQIAKGQLPEEGTSTNLSFQNSRHGWFGTGDIISYKVNLFQTSDGGSSWHKVSAPVPLIFHQKSHPYNVTTPKFNGKQGTFVATFTKLEDGAYHNYMVVYHTDNSGTTWTEQGRLFLTGVTANAIRLR